MAHATRVPVPSGPTWAGASAAAPSSRLASRRHPRTTARPLGAAGRGEVPAGCGSAVPPDRAAVDVVQRIVFTVFGSVTGTR
ncbi:hypothetical protein [Streptomyces malaysiense]|uniref:Uncharacterized protein n=1 Tax=Streptomyces malaysiense TaxID=1428626 RepID=A0A1J4Q7L7_9ACTN|nr:hypothetical protein [Streptomyces malaysiense]OIK28961.1 hypothetical protein VT52_002460 [Streptomyces malaysiense]